MGSNRHSHLMAEGVTGGGNQLDVCNACTSTGVIFSLWLFQSGHGVTCIQDLILAYFFN